MQVAADVACGDGVFSASSLVDVLNTLLSEIHVDMLGVGAHVTAAVRPDELAGRPARWVRDRPAEGSVAADGKELDADGGELAIQDVEGGFDLYISKADRRLPTRRGVAI